MEFYTECFFDEHVQYQTYSQMRGLLFLMQVALDTIQKAFICTMIPQTKNNITFSIVDDMPTYVKHYQFKYKLK